MTDLKVLLKDSAQKLVTSDAPDVDAYEILRKVTGFSRQDILIKSERDVCEEKLAEFRLLIEKRAT